MKSKQRIFEIDLIPKGASAPKRHILSVKRAWGLFFVILLSLSSWFLLIKGIPTLQKLWGNPSVQILEKENRTLQATLDKLDYQSAAVTRQLEQLGEQQERVFGLADLQKPSAKQASRILPKNGEEALNRAKELAALAATTRALTGDPELLASRFPLVIPFKSPHLVSIPFGPRFDSFTGKRMMHEGIDFPEVIGDTIVAPADGSILFPSLPRGFGSALRINHDNDVATIYTHLERALVSQGQRVKRGTPIALLGNSGRSSAPHLHYEVRRNNIPIDPTLLLFDIRTIASTSLPGIEQ